MTKFFLSMVAAVLIMGGTAAQAFDGHGGSDVSKAATNSGLEGFSYASTGPSRYGFGNVASSTSGGFVSSDAKAGCKGCAASAEGHVAGNGHTDNFSAGKAESEGAVQFGGNAEAWNVDFGKGELAGASVELSLDGFAYGATGPKFLGGAETSTGGLIGAQADAGCSRCGADADSTVGGVSGSYGSSFGNGSTEAATNYQGSAESYNLDFGRGHHRR
jgi:hypothetical protein